MVIINGETLKPNSSVPPPPPIGGFARISNIKYEMGWLEKFV